MEQPQIISDEEQKEGLWSRKRQVYYHALPFHTGRADLFRLPLELEETASGLIDDLLNKGAFEEMLQPASFQSIPFDYWLQELRNQKRLYDNHPLALGFPLLCYTEGASLRAVPLFLFDLLLEPDGQQKGYRRLSHGYKQRVRLNPWLQANPPQSWAPKQLEDARALAQKRPLTKERLANFLSSLPEHADWAPLPEEVSLEPCPEISQLDNLDSGGKTYWAGIVACFPPAAFEGKPEKELRFPEAAPYATEGHASAGATMDPYQMTAFQAGRLQRLSVVEGRSGTGKSFVLQQLLLNALSNGEKCLIVAPTLESLRSIRQQMDRLLLGAMVFSATNPARDVRLLREILRTAGELTPPAQDFHAESFQQVLHKWERQKNKLDDAYRALRQPVFGKYSWTETVGLYLESSRLEGKELLTAQLNIQDFRFRYEEYEALIGAVRQCQGLYERVNTLRHPLSNLHRRVFLEKEREAARAFVYEQLEVFIRKLFSLQKRYIEKVNEYADLLSNYYEERYDTLEKQLQSLQEQIADAVAEYGRDFELNSMTSLRLYGSFLSRFRERLEAKKAIFKHYHQLVKDFEKNPLFDFEFALAEEGRALPRMRKSLDAFQAALVKWREKLPDLIQDNLSRLSSKNIHPELPFKGRLIELEEALDLRLAELNRTQLYGESFENRMLTIPRRRKYLEEVIEQLENTKLYMHDFDALYDWRRFWLGLTDAGRKLVQALIKVRPVDPEAAFKSWYLHHCLQQAYQPALPTAVSSLRQFVFNNDQLQSKLPAQISHHWWGRRQELLRELRRNDRRRYQQFFTRKNGEEKETLSLVELLEDFGEMITELLPVWLVTPEVAQAISRQGGYFDVMLLEEAHLLPASSLGAELMETNRIIAFGNREWEALGPVDSAFALAGQQVKEVCRLPYLHRWSPGDAPALRDPAKLTQDAISGFSARFKQVDGRYDENARINEAEAQTIIRLLNEVEKTPQRTYPSIAIAAMTTAQRDLIASFLRDIRQRELPGAEILRQLERNGLGTFHIDELAGQQPDVLILSCTYGPVDLEGSVTDHLQELNRPEGPAKLSLLMSRPRKAVFVVNSVPQPLIRKNAENPSRPGTFLLSNYLKYIYALHISDTEQQQQVIQNLAGHFPPGGPERPDSPFIREVALALQSFIAKERIHAQTMDAHLYLPLKIDPGSVEASPVVVVPDGFFSPTPETDYRWEFERQTLYEQQGYALAPAWSVNWWKNAAAEARELADEIEEKSAEDMS